MELSEFLEPRDAEESLDRDFLWRRLFEDCFSVVFEGISGLFPNFVKSLPPSLPLPSPLQGGGEHLPTGAGVVLCDHPDIPNAITNDAVNNNLRIGHSLDTTAENLEP